MISTQKNLIVEIYTFKILYEMNFLNKEFDILSFRIKIGLKKTMIFLMSLLINN